MQRWGRAGVRRTAQVAVVLTCLAAVELTGPAAEASLRTQVEPPTPRAGEPVREDTYISSAPSDVRRFVLTSGGANTYSLALATRRVRASAPTTNRGENLRLAWTPSRAPASVDSEACLTWTRRDSGLVQPGVALRARRDGARERVITVTNNIYFGARWAWNVHLWETGQPFRQLGSIYLTEAFGGRVQDLPPLPWRLCARIIGSTVELKAWPLSSTPTEPAWGDARYGGKVKVPSDWVFPGQSGWYVGHLLPGEWSEANQMGSWALRQTRGDDYGRAVGAWAEDLYPLLFDRSADDGSAYWADQAMARGGGWVVSNMSTSLEARRKTVSDMYQQVLLRPPDPGGHSYWAERLRTRPDVEALILAVVMRDEFSGQRDDPAFVAALYERILGRTADPAGVDHWVGRLADGLSRRAVASYFVRSPENRAVTVRATYEQVFGRSPTSAEQAQWGAWFVAVGLNRLRLQSSMALFLLPSAPG